MERLFLDDPFRTLWKGKDPFREAFALAGEDFREVKSRRTTRFELDGKGYFIKKHFGIGLKEYLKDLFQLKKPVTGAGQEFDALNLLREKGIPTMEVAAFGSRRTGSIREKSFLVTRELSCVTSLEDFCLVRGKNLELPLRRRLIRALAESAGKMHRAGLNHRDCYICHYLLDRKKLEAGEYVLYVIDLHRAQIRKKVPERYLVKDLAGLYFSAMSGTRLTRHDVYRFLEAYFLLPLPEIFARYRRLLEKVQDTAEALFEKENGSKMPRLFSGKP
ncbi:MAG: lipopolysaccharide core heptose(I) kinase RfaP [Lentisphaeria bacterium]|nr:lipopolysaccharide core heptose(I) kinase RfaP [Lentisphaeria bacterium]